MSYNYLNLSENTYINLADATEEDLKRCFHYEQNATCIRGWEFQVQGKMYTALQYSWTDRFGRAQVRFALGHPAIQWSTRIGETGLFQYFNKELQVYDPDANEGEGKAYLRLAIEPTEAELVAYEERLRKQREREEAMANRAKPVIEIPKFMYTKW